MNMKAYLEQYRIALGLEAKLKPIDLDQTNRLAKHLSITDPEALAVFHVTFFHLKAHTTLDLTTRSVTAYAVSKGVLALRTAESLEEVKLVVIGAPSGLVFDDETKVKCADIALDYLYRMLDVAEESVKGKISRTVNGEPMDGRNVILTPVEETLEVHDLLGGYNSLGNYNGMGGFRV